MKLIGLTGSIGMGKSTTAAMFKAEGAPVYDADAAVHQLYEGAAPPALQAAFPQAVVAGRVDRALLSREVLNDAGAFRRLEAIVHPLVAAERTAFAQRACAAGATCCVLDIPLLFETGAERFVHVVVVASASPAVQEERVLARPNMSQEKFKAILARQYPDAEKRKRAHAIIQTDGGLAFARRQVAQLLRTLCL